MGSGRKTDSKFRFTDFLVVLLCLSGAVYSINLFRLDLFQTLNGQNKTPIGSVTIKRNTVQRRMSDRILWDRLIKASPVYSDDIIRVADNSEANLNVGGHDIALNENTLVRLRYNEETGEFQIELTAGNIGLVTAPEGGNVVLNIMGRQVEAKPGTALNAAAGDNGVALQVSEGTAAIKERGSSRELAAGAAIAMDDEGSVRSEPGALVIQPRPNALYRKTGNEPFNVAFSWSRINLQPNETLRLEIAEDQNFSRSVRTLDGLNDSAQAALNAGLWNWRLIYRGAANNSVLGSGRFTITDASGPELLSPANNQQFFYETELPRLYFQWSGADDVSYYIIEVDVTPEFRNPIIKKQATVTSLADSSLEEGIWYWRVTPVFAQSGEGGGVSPRTAAFRIVKSREPQTPPLFAQAEEVPAPPPEPAPAPKPARPSPPKRVTLESPNQETTLPGLTALRQQTVFQWNSQEAVAKSRFVLSRNTNPLRGKPEIEILDPNRTIRVDRLKEGVWYWTVEAKTPGGADITAQSPRRLQILPIPLLPAPANRLPAAGYRVGIEELKKITLNFKWSAVSGANAYIFTLYQEIDKGRRQITQTGPENSTSWTADIKTLGRGHFVWQVEAVNVGRNNIIEQRGMKEENRFVIDIPRPGPIQIIEEPEDE
jgi:hypothetical protein